MAFESFYIWFAVAVACFMTGLGFIGVAGTIMWQILRKLS